jgi:hypothetical protein
MLLVPLSILISWLRLIGYGPHRFEGTPIGIMPLPLLARLYMHAVPVTVSILTAILLALYDVISGLWVLPPVVAGAILVALPIRYTFSEKGIRRTFGTFRRWTEFAGVERAPGGARLKPLSKARPARVWLSGSRGDDEFLQLLRTLIRNAYKGSADVPVFPGTILPMPGQEDLMTSSTPSVAAFQRCEPA